MSYIFFSFLAHVAAKIKHVYYFGCENLEGDSPFRIRWMIRLCFIWFFTKYGLDKNLAQFSTHSHGQFDFVIKRSTLKKNWNVYLANNRFLRYGFRGGRSPYSPLKYAPVRHLIISIVARGIKYTYKSGTVHADGKNYESYITYVSSEMRRRIAVLPPVYKREVIDLGGIIFGFYCRR
jgi:hypothetical protein